ncbi:2OG-Fe(II) oxygenase [Caulobacter sp. S45]|uniref:2OG-Fe(II) oxygenase n=1 Tax=Caulobacter sp. S45 TaxID=1641861 RepID=UPI00131B9B28
MPFIGPEIVSQRCSEEDGRGEYPSGTAVDRVIQQLLQPSPVITEIIGHPGETWARISACPFAYPVGTGIRWHTDRIYSGAFVYYANMEWRPNWGGELLVGGVVVEGPGVSPAHRRGLFGDEHLQWGDKGGAGVFIAPLPNRLVLIRGGTPHMVKRVEPAAGDRPRVSVAGFFTP